LLFSYLYKLRNLSYFDIIVNILIFLTGVVIVFEYAKQDLEKLCHFFEAMIEMKKMLTIDLFT